MNFRQLFSSAKKNIVLKDLIGRDVHAHLIPNIDDGPKTMEEAIKLIKGLQKIGYHTLTATPHVYSQFYPNSMETIERVFNQLQKAVTKAKINIQLNCAAEYYLEDAFEILLEKGEILKLDGNRVLVETSLLAQDPKLFHYIFNMPTKSWI